MKPMTRDEPKFNYLAARNYAIAMDCDDTWEQLDYLASRDKAPAPKSLENYPRPVTVETPDPLPDRDVTSDGSSLSAAEVIGLAAVVGVAIYGVYLLWEHFCGDKAAGGPSSEAVLEGEARLKALEAQLQEREEHARQTGY